MKHFLKGIGALALAVPMGALAQDVAPEPQLQQGEGPMPSEIVRFDVEARADYSYVGVDGHTSKSNSGFQGKYLTMRVDGTILPGLTYSWTQRFNKPQAFFEATAWLYLNYEIGRWGIRGGKEVVAIGGFEYDRAPIDLYSCSVFWNNVPCYQFGVSGSYGITPSDRITFQVTQSPFYTPENKDMYAYNLMWNGRHGCFESLYSANLLEYKDGCYISYLALGNRFTVGKWALELDLMNRAASRQTYFFKDCSVMAELAFKPSARWRIHAKYTYDVNHADNGADLIVAQGTELSMAGAGVEFYPLMKKRHRLRIHAGCFYSWGNNGNPDNLLQNKTLFVNAGLTWDMNLLNIKRKPKN